MNQHLSKINDAEVCSYIQKGKSIPIVFLHGFCEDSSIWFDLLDDFSEINFICIDLPGFGKSETQLDCGIDKMANIVNIILEEHEVEKCILIGHSMGGYVALEFVKSFPTKCIGLGLFHSQPNADTVEKKENRKKSIDFIKKNGSILFVKQLIPKLFAPRFGTKSSFTISKLVLAASKYSSNGIINALEAMIYRTDNQQVINNISIPVLFIVGEYDKAIPSANSYNQLALPGISQIHILDGVGHMGMFEARSKCVKFLKQFFNFVHYAHNL